MFTKNSLQGYLVFDFTGSPIHPPSRCSQLPVHVLEHSPQPRHAVIPNTALALHRLCSSWTSPPTPDRSFQSAQGGSQTRFRASPSLQSHRPWHHYLELCHLLALAILADRTSSLMPHLRSTSSPVPPKPFSLFNSPKVPCWPTPTRRRCALAAALCPLIAGLSTLEPIKLSQTGRARPSDLDWATRIKRSQADQAI
jgi:hypothetical protein